jgi:hypothetical protein
MLRYLAATLKYEKSSDAVIRGTIKFKPRVSNAKYPPEVLRIK